MLTTRRRLAWISSLLARSPALHDAQQPALLGGVESSPLGVERCRGEVAVLDELGQAPLVVGGEQVDLADLVQVHAHRRRTCRPSPFGAARWWSAAAPPAQQAARRTSSSPARRATGAVAPSAAACRRRRRRPPRRWSIPRVGQRRLRRRRARRRSARRRGARASTSSACTAPVATTALDQVVPTRRRRPRDRSWSPGALVGASRPLGHSALRSRVVRLHRRCSQPSNHSAAAAALPSGSSVPRPASRASPVVADRGRDRSTASRRRAARGAPRRRSGCAPRPPGSASTSATAARSSTSRASGSARSSAASRSPPDVGEGEERPPVDLVGEQRLDQPRRRSSSQSLHQQRDGDELGVLRGAGRAPARRPGSTGRRSRRSAIRTRSATGSPTWAATSPAYSLRTLTSGCSLTTAIASLGQPGPLLRACAAARPSSTRCRRKPRNGIGVVDRRGQRVRDRAGPARPGPCPSGSRATLTPRPGTSAPTRRSARPRPGRRRRRRTPARPGWRSASAAARAPR